MILLLLFILFFYLNRKTRYEKTDYYLQTHNAFSSALFDKGISGEYAIWKSLYTLGGYKKCLLNCYLPKNNQESTEIDLILLHESGIHVFESKNYSGWIFGTATQQNWTQVLPKGYGRSQKNKFFNPIFQNDVHLKWLGKYLNKKPESFYSYIVFGDHCTLKNITLTNDRHKVINRRDLFEAVNANVQSNCRKLTIDEIDTLYVKLLPFTQMDSMQKAMHIEKIRKQRISSDSMSCTRTQTCPMRCPRCGGKLVLRTAKKGVHEGQNFWGCSNYPRCRYVKDANRHF